MCVCVYTLKERMSVCDKKKKKQLLQLSQQWRVSMNPGQAPQKAAEQKACKLRMCSVEARPNLTLC